MGIFIRPLLWVTSTLGSLYASSSERPVVVSTEEYERMEARKSAINPPAAATNQPSGAASAEDGDGPMESVDLEQGGKDEEGMREMGGRDLSSLSMPRMNQLLSL